MVRAQHAVPLQVRTKQKQFEIGERTQNVIENKRTVKSGE